MGITAPAVSQQISRIERTVGAPVVERSVRGARLTQLGLLLAEHSDRVAAELAATDTTIATFLGTNARRLRLGAFPSAAVGLLPEALAAIRYRHPDAELSVLDLPSDAGNTLVASGNLDLALVASYGQAIETHGQVRLEHLLSDPIQVILADDHSLAASDPKRPVPLTALRDEAWVCGIQGRPARNQLMAAAAELGFVPRTTFQTESYDVAQALTASGVAVAFVPRLAVTQVRSTTSRSLTPALRREIYVALPSVSNTVPLAAELLGFLRDLCAETGPGS